MLVIYMLSDITNSIWLRLSLFWVVIMVSQPGALAQEIDSLLTESPVDYYQQEDSLKTKRSPRGAMIRSLVVPGWGQWYNGRKIKSIVIFVAETSFISAIFINNNRLVGSNVPEDRSFYRDERNKFFWWLGGIIGYSVLDAFVDAYLQGFSVDMDINKETGTTALFKVKVSVPF